MGFSSAECHGCHKSVLAPHRLPKIMVWMNRCVMITEAGAAPLIGDYDGYGGVTSDDGEYHGRDPETGAGVSPLGDYLEAVCGCSQVSSTVWHEACWRIAGEPAAYRGPSTIAADQGFFFEEADYMIPEPKASN